MKKRKKKRNNRIFQSVFNLNNIEKQILQKGQKKCCKNFAVHKKQNDFTLCENKAQKNRLKIKIKNNKKNIA